MMYFVKCKEVTLEDSIRHLQKDMPVLSRLQDIRKMATNITLTRPAWFKDLLGIDSFPAEGETVLICGIPMLMRGGILRSCALVSEAQKQTEQTFGFKWHQRDTFEREEVLANMRAWLIERYGNITEAPWPKEYGERPLILDAGCGAGMSALELFGPVLDKVRYLGVDISVAIDVAATRFAEKGLWGGFLQVDVGQVPLAPGSVDVIFSEGVLHHTDSPEKSFTFLASLLKTGGRIMFYVYRKKGPMREFTDDYVRDRLQNMTPEQAWNALMPLTKLGKQLGDLGIEIDISEPIDLLQIPPGRINVQRLIYWHVFKAFYRPEMTLDELNHVNFDWYAPRNAYRFTVEEVRAWCAKAGLTVERERVEEAGISVIARKEGR